MSDDGSLLVTTSFDAYATLWDVKSGHELDQFGGVFVAFHAPAFSPDRTRLAMLADRGEVSVWEVSSHERLATIPGVGRLFVAWYGGDDLLATLGEEGLRLWRAPAWEEIAAAEAAQKR
jgi:WD40 repeat protein